MTKTGLSSPRRLLARILVGLVFLTAGAAVLLLHSARLALLEQNRALRQKIEQASSRWNENLTLHQTNSDTPTLSEEHFRELLRLRAEANRLRQQQHDLTCLATENRQLRTNLLADALEFGGHELTHQEIDVYLARHGRSAKSLLTAARLTHDTALLEEALKASPNDPQALLAAAMQRDWTGQRRQRLDDLKQAAPNNALAYYLSAQDYFASGQIPQALQELATGNGQPSLEDFSAESFRLAEDLFLGLGYSEAAAKAAAWNSREYSSLNSLAKLEKSLRELVKSDHQSGDGTSAGAVLQMGLQLGRRLADDPAEFKTLDRESLGLTMQKRLLQTTDPAPPDRGIAVGDGLENLARRRAEIASSEDPPGWDGYLLKHLSEAEVIGYFDRLRTDGELEARRWALIRQKTD